MGQEFTAFYKQVRSVCRLATQAYFRRVEVTGLENVPAEGGGLVVSWHPNGLIDPGLIFIWFPRAIIFGARHGLFEVPGLGQMMRGVGAVPIYRAQDSKSNDPAARRAANKKSLGALADAIAAGSWSCLFPEGDSHDLPYLLSLKTGAARLYYQARSAGQARSAESAGRPTPVILPVSLHYDAKQAFRSDVLVQFHPPIAIPTALDVDPDPDEPHEDSKARAESLTREIERVLHDVTDTTDDWDLHHLLHRARKLVRAERSLRAGREPPPESLLERAAGFGEVRDNYYARVALYPDAVADLRARLEGYDLALRAAHIEDHEIDRDPKVINRWLFFILGLQWFTIFVLVPPFIALGVIIHLPIALGLWALSKAASPRIKDEASVKLLFGALAFPATWLTVGILAARAHAEVHAAMPAIPDAPLMAGLMTVAAGIFGAGLAIRYLRVARQTGRALRVLWTRRRKQRVLAWLKEERAGLYDEITALYRRPGKEAPDQPAPPE